MEVKLFETIWKQLDIIWNYGPWLALLDCNKLQLRQSKSSRFFYNNFSISELSISRDTRFEFRSKNHTFRVSRSKDCKMTISLQAKQNQSDTKTKRKT